MRLRGFSRLEVAGPRGLNSRTPPWVIRIESSLEAVVILFVPAAFEKSW
jgi:hypothetical protein